MTHSEKMPPVSALKPTQEASVRVGPTAGIGFIITVAGAIF